MPAPAADLRILRNGLLAIQDRDGNNHTSRQYTWGLNLGGGIGGLLAMYQVGANYQYLYDGKGNVTTVLDTVNQTVASYRYDVFGKLLRQSGTLEQPFTFSTKRYFAQLGLNYYGYRYYQPAVGRWLTRDPLQEAGGLNLYGFVQNNPVNIIDPYGLEGFVGIGVSPVGPDPSAHPVFQPGTPQNDIIVEDTKKWFSPSNMMTLLKMSIAFQDPNLAVHLMAKKSKLSPKERATDKPSWAPHYPMKPDDNDNCKKWAARILNAHYGEGDPRACKRGPVSEYNKLVKWCNRGFQ